MRRKIYLAGSFSDKEKIEKLAKKLENEGFIITEKWWLSNIKNKKPDDPIEWLKQKDVEKIFLKNIVGVLRADILIIVFNKRKYLQGALVELGVAIPFRSNKKIFALGKPENKSVMFYPIERFFDNTEDLIKEIKGGDKSEYNR